MKNWPCQRASTFQLRGTSWERVSNLILSIDQMKWGSLFLRGEFNSLQGQKVSLPAFEVWASGLHVMSVPARMFSVKVFVIDQDGHCFLLESHPQLLISCVLKGLGKPTLNICISKSQR